MLMVSKSNGFGGYQWLFITRKEWVAASGRKQCYFNGGHWDAPSEGRILRWK